MNALQVLQRIGPFDIKTVGRDSLLRWMLVVPPGVALLLRFVLPPIRDVILESLRFDIEPLYVPVIAAYFLMLFTPVIFGMLIGFMMLDERDDRTLLALQVTPMPLASYLAYRLFAPIIISVVLTVASFYIWGLVPVPFGTLVASALLAALSAPIFALFLASFAENKVAGFALMKSSAPLLIGPIVAYFLPGAWEFLFMVLPTYWPVKFFWSLVEQGQHGSPLIWAAGTVIYSTALIVVLLRRFNVTMSRIG